MTTTTLFNVIRSELQKAGFNEFESKKPQTSIFPFGEFQFFDVDAQFTTKVLNFDKDVQKIIKWLFNGMALNDEVADNHFKHMFLLRFANRQINFQTIESFKFKLCATFLTNEEFINRVYNDAEKYIQHKTISLSKNNTANKTSQTNDSIGSNRQAYSETPQNEINLDLNNDTMTYANDNTISKNKQNSNSNSDSNTKSDANTINNTYLYDNFIKSSLLYENIMKVFDRDCFLQIW